MPTLSRREFIKLCAGSAAAISMSNLLVPYLAEAAPGAPPVIWIQGASCTGCSISLLNTVHPDIKEVLLEIISLKFHPNVMAAAGDLAMEAIDQTVAANPKGYYLVVEGAVPTKDNGIYCTVGETHDGKPIMFADLVKRLGDNAAAVLAVGTCSAFGGVPAADPNPTGCVPVSGIVKGTPIVNIAGCPPHPDWLVGTIAHILLYKDIPQLDKQGRPTMFFSGTVHDNCPRRQYFDNSIFAKTFGEPGCLLEIGCKGPMAHCDASTRLWNNGTNWCVNCGAPCLACTEPAFPDGTSPVYKRLPEFTMGPQISLTADTVGMALGALTAAGIAGHLAGNVLTGRIAGNKEAKKEGDK